MSTGDWLAAAATAEPSRADLIEQGLLVAGDLLDSANQDGDIDAAITEDGTIMIDGEHEFDSLDEAARHLGVTSLSGYEFWALGRDGGYAKLAELGEGRR